MQEIPLKHYGLIYTDPPWSYRLYSEKGHEKSPHAQYECMDLEKLKGMRDDIIFRTAPDCVLFMWGVFPMVPQALDLIQHWGFTYKTGGAWHKRSSTFVDGQANPKSQFGPGYILRSAAEPFFIATRGNPRTKNKSTRNIIEAAVRGHSRKPDIHAMIEGLFDGPYLEMFGRQQRKGWDVWGNEANKFDQPLDGKLA